MNKTSPNLKVQEVDDLFILGKTLDILVLASGFEDRAFAFLSKSIFHQSAECILIKYVNDTKGNEDVFAKFEKEAKRKFSAKRLRIIEMNRTGFNDFYLQLESALASIRPDLRRIAIDVSGMTSYLSCLALKCIRLSRPLERQLVIYSSAETYVPNHKEYLELVEKQGEDIEYLPRSMAQEMSDNLILDHFSGHQSGDGKACLIIFAGYEIHRSTGMIDATNPSLVLLMHGNPGDQSLSWRLDLAKRLHRKHERSRRCAVEVVSTLQVQESLDKLEEYYNFLIDDYDFVISPICSKMHVVASYLFWEKYGEVQLSFPLPVGYNKSNRPMGVGKVYSLELTQKSLLARQ